MNVFSETIRGGYIGFDACDKNHQTITEILSLDEGLSADFHDFLTKSGWGVRLQELGMETYFNMSDGSQMATTFLSPEIFKELVDATGGDFSILHESYDKWTKADFGSVVIHIEKDASFLDI
ncbi:hypothetical protein OTK49_00220 [Vibrio coralliirubri]|uniref:hypothetical protein n=1 Tax=Vibrio coralliirubri TaxID=1516159 RepID=UPI0022853129|nr:hypothetical protein [Vibrio coralliirubri]MCY9860965.1 hypothetical protein [Vibrio coralliirubri]